MPAGSWPAVAATVLRDVMAEFAVPVEYRPADGPAFALAGGGVFDEDHVAVALELETPVSASGPRLLVALEDWPDGVGPAQEDTLAVEPGTPRERVWRVFDVQPDGQGGALLILRRT